MLASEEILDAAELTVSIHQHMGRCRPFSSVFLLSQLGRFISSSSPASPQWTQGPCSLWRMWLTSPRRASHERAKQPWDHVAAPSHLGLLPMTLQPIKAGNAARLYAGFFSDLVPAASPGAWWPWHSGFCLL